MFYYGNDVELCKHYMVNIVVILHASILRLPRHQFIAKNCCCYTRFTLIYVIDWYICWISDDKK